MSTLARQAGPEGTPRTSDVTEDPVALLRKAKAAANRYSRQLAISEAAELLAHSDGATLGQIAAAELDQEFYDAMKLHFKAHAQADDQWVEQLIDWLIAAQLSPQRCLKAMTGIAWSLRSDGSSPLEALDTSTLLTRDQTEPRSALRFMIALQAARFSFDFSRINTLLDVIPKESSAYYPEFFEAMKYFAAYGTSHTGEPEALLRLAESTTDRKVIHIAAHALWFSNDEADCHALVAVTTRILALNPNSPVARYRQGAAYRRLGQFDDALRTVTEGINLADPTDVADNQMLIEEHQRILLQKELVEHMKMVNAEAEVRLKQTISDTKADMLQILETERDSARRATADAQMTSIEILGLFMAVLTVLAGGLGAASIGELEWWQRVLIVLSGTVGAVTLFVILRFVVNPYRSGKVPA